MWAGFYLHFIMKNLWTQLNNISPYGLCGVIGFLGGIIYLAIVSKWKKKSFEDMIYIYVWAIIGAVIGAKIMYLVVDFPEIIKVLAQNRVDMKQYILSNLSGGFVFYGGLIGAVISVKMSSRYFGVDENDAFFLLVPLMPFVHAFGRIGCLLVGCCYGIETALPFGIVYSDSEFAPNGVKLLPVQAIEAGIDLMIFGFLIYIIIKDNRKWNMLNIYLCLYAGMRFVLEYFRGDQIRGSFGCFSTSQWISMIILMVVLIGFIKKKIDKTGAIL